MKKSILFYSSVGDKSLFSIQQFYCIDINLLRELGYNVILSNRIVDALCFWRFDIAFIYFYRYGLFVALLARLFFKKVYFTGGIDLLDREYASSKDYWVQRLFFKLCYALSHRCIVVSKADLENIKSVCRGKLLSKIYLSEHTIDVNSFSPYGDKKKQFMTIAWMGNQGNVIRKGLDKALHLFANLISKPEFSDYNMVIVGKQGEGSDFLRQIIKELKIENKVIFMGDIDEKSKIRAIIESEYYFQLSKYEGFGLAAIEAMAAGCIIVHSGKGGLKYTVGNFGIPFDINQGFDKESIKVYEELIQFNKSQIRLQIESVCERFNNDRRKEDFFKIIQ